MNATDVQFLKHEDQSAFQREPRIQIGASVKQKLARTNRSRHLISQRRVDLSRKLNCNLNASVFQLLTLKHFEQQANYQMIRTELLV